MVRSERVLAAQRARVMMKSRREIKDSRAGEAGKLAQRISVAWS